MYVKFGDSSSIGFEISLGKADRRRWKPDPATAIRLANPQLAYVRKAETRMRPLAAWCKGFCRQGLLSTSGLVWKTTAATRTSPIKSDTSAVRAALPRKWKQISRIRRQCWHTPRWTVNKGVMTWTMSRHRTRTTGSAVEAMT